MFLLLFFCFLVCFVSVILLPQSNIFHFLFLSGGTIVVRATGLVTTANTHFAVNGGSGNSVGTGTQPHEHTIQYCCNWYATT